MELRSFQQEDGWGNLLTLEEHSLTKWDDGIEFVYDDEGQHWDIFRNSYADYFIWYGDFKTKEEAKKFLQTKMRSHLLYNFKMSEQPKVYWKEIKREVI